MTPRKGRGWGLLLRRSLPGRGRGQCSIDEPPFGVLDLPPGRLGASERSFFASRSTRANEGGVIFLRSRPTRGGEGPGNRKARPGPEGSPAAPGRKKKKRGRREEREERANTNNVHHAEAPGHTPGDSLRLRLRVARTVRPALVPSPPRPDARPRLPPRRSPVPPHGADTDPAGGGHDRPPPGGRGSGG